jgi:AraC family transcriptional regulator
MQPTIVEKGPITLVGLSFYGDPFSVSGGWTEENEIGRLWVRFERYLSQHPDKIKRAKSREVAFEVHIEHEETSSKGLFEIFVGMEVEKLEDVPVELLVKTLPATQYAVFTLKGMQISSDWGRMIYQDWLPQSGYQLAHPFSFQLYDERFKGLDRLEESALDLYMPVKSEP